MPLHPDRPVAPILSELGQAMFHYYDHNQRLPVGIVYSFTDDGNQVIAFPVSSLPAAAQTGDCFAGELFFYRKAIPFCITVKGTAEICSGTPFYIRFSVQDLAVQEFSANSFRQATRHIQKKSMAAVH
ncbi:MAG TPA: hypothetical protein VLD19_10065 [Chitinophagaceae bacterium]|nr:hypothetical protein [Chitinophagaceae bacterium]